MNSIGKYPLKWGKYRFPNQLAWDNIKNWGLIWCFEQDWLKNMPPSMTLFSTKWKFHKKRPSNHKLIMKIIVIGDMFRLNENGTQRTTWIPLCE